MREKLLHANLIPLLLEIHVHQEVLWVLISIGSFEHHFYVVDCAHISLSNIYDYAWVLVLDQDNFVSFTFWFKCYVWLSDY